MPCGVSNRNWNSVGPPRRGDGELARKPFPAALPSQAWWCHKGLRLSLVRPVYERYDVSMTRLKIAISLPKDQLARVHREVRAGRADSVSGYIAHALEEQGKRESLQALLRDLTEQYGKPAAKDIKWAERALAPPRA